MASGLMCFINILGNLGKCLKFYFQELLAVIFWGIVYAVSFIFLFLPVYIGLFIFCMAVDPKKFWYQITGDPFGPNGCFNVKPQDICPSFNETKKSIDMLIMALTGKTVFYRSKRDVDKCYCLGGMKKIALRSKIDFSGISFANAGSFTFTTVIIGLLLYIYAYLINK